LTGKSGNRTFRVESEFADVAYDAGLTGQAGMDAARTGWTETPRLRFRWTLRRSRRAGGVGLPPDISPPRFVSAPAGKRPCDRRLDPLFQTSRQPANDGRAEATAWHDDARPSTWREGVPIRVVARGEDVMRGSTHGAGIMRPPGRTGAAGHRSRTAGGTKCDWRISRPDRDFGERTVGGWGHSNLVFASDFEGSISDSPVSRRNGFEKSRLRIRRVTGKVMM